MGDTYGACGSLDARALEGLHQLFEAFALFAAQKVLAFDVEVIKCQLIFLHTAVAQHFDLAAGHAVGWKRVFLGAGSLFGQKH